MPGRQTLFRGFLPATAQRSHFSVDPMYFCHLLTCIQDADGQVGKSSLLNALVNRKRHKLVRTSGRPGQTKTLNGFGVGSELTLVDTPGYGFGSRDAWGPLVMDFLQQRQCLKRTILLVDGMHGPKEADERLIAELGKRGIPFQVLLTKVDRLRDEAGLREMLDGVEVLVRKLGGAAVHGELLAVSSEKERTGIALLRASIARTCTLATQGPRRTQKVNK